VRRIRELNDAFRATFLGGRVMLTSGVAALPDSVKARVLSAVRAFEDFDEGNDHHNEHDFVPVEIDGHKVFGKIDYYDKDIRLGCDDPSIPESTTRVLTVMLADEY
jgi:hypothetical protein